jgi:hypothetical protein
MFEVLLYANGGYSSASKIASERQTKPRLVYNILRVWYAYTEKRTLLNQVHPFAELAKSLNMRIHAP